METQGETHGAVEPAVRTRRVDAGDVGVGGRGGVGGEGGHVIPYPNTFLMPPFYVYKTPTLVGWALP